MHFGWSKKSAPSRRWDNGFKLLKRNGRHEETRTPDLYRVNFDVNNLKPFACLAFPQTTYLKTPRKHPIFGDELVTSSSSLRTKETIFNLRWPATGAVS